MVLTWCSGAVTYLFQQLLVSMPPTWSGRVWSAVLLVITDAGVMERGQAWI